MSNMYNIDSGKPSSKVLRPPGGGSSDIFGTDKPSTPRHTNNRMQSNIFSAEQNASVKNNAPAPAPDYRRGQRNVDSYSRLFGEPDRPFTPAKNHMKSSIPINNGANGNDSTDNAKRNNGNHTNGYSNNTNTGFVPHKNKVENCSANGFIYGSGHHEAQQLQREQKEQRQEQQRQEREDQKQNVQDQQHQTRQEQQDQRQQAQDQRQQALDQRQQEQDQQQRQQSQDHRQQDQDNRQQDQDQHQRQQNGNGTANGNGKSDGGNPVTGEGYNKNGEINTSIPSLNGANQVINRNRIPPGGYSSGLW